MPVCRTVPADGAYVNVPGTLAEAFNCAPPSTVPSGTAAGVCQTITGCAARTLSAALPEAGARPDPPEKLAVTAPGYEPTPTDPTLTPFSVATPAPSVNAEPTGA